MLDAQVALDDLKIFSFFDEVGFQGLGDQVFVHGDKGLMMRM
jgi:hypothetical protein